MSAATQQPIVPPRPTKAQDTPKIPPRPARKAVDRSLSPSRDRFAPSPLDSLLSKSPNRATFTHGPSALAADPVDRSSSVDLPSVGQEGMEYAAVSEELSNSRSASPEHTRTVGEDLKLHAPKPSLPAISAKQRVATVTRTDSEKAASFGIGQATGADDGTKKKGSTTSQELSEEGLDEDEHGIPEIGRQVPMYPNAGDVQAPSPSPDMTRNHSRKKSARGFSDLPPGSYGLHGHGVIGSDKLEKAYYGKHPELIEKEHTPHHADRVKDYSLTSADLNKIVRDTASRGSGISTHDINGTPSEQVGWQAIEESASRPASVAPKGKSNSFGSQSSATGRSGTPGISLSAPPDDNVIHVEDPNNRRKSVMFDESESPDFDYESEAPILAADEVAKDPSAYEHEPAVTPAFERRLSSIDGDEGSSRPSSRPASIYRVSSVPQESAIAEDKDEEDYEPLFKDGDTKTGRAPSVKSMTDEAAPRFPSRDIWEDAPNSAHYTAEVSTPDMPIKHDEEGYVAHRPSTDSPRDGETPAQAFARQQEELAEKELQGADAFAENRKPHKPTPTSWAKEKVLAPAGNTHAPTSSPAGSSSSSLRRPQLGQRFPSRDVWEDVPESLQLQTVVSNPQEEEVPSPIEPSKPAVPQRPVRKNTDPSDKAVPVVPSRPKPKSVSSEEGKPKPVVPARPVRHQQPSASEEPAESVPKAKPAVPARPFGGKIAQLQANFMSDLNKKLKIGPQAPKKEDPEPEEEQPVAEKAPLVDARKGRARGPQRSAPRAAAATSAAPAASSTPTLAFSMTTTLYSIDPEDGGLVVTSGKLPEADKADEKPVAPAEAVEEKKEEPVEAPAEETVEESAEEPIEKTETIASNTAGEPVAEAKVEVSPSTDAVEPVKEAAEE